jgi:tetratricopeptide (TPR) repeat protein
MDKPVEVARLRIEEGHRTGDPGFYALAEPNDPEARRHLVHIAIQFHQFASAEADARALATETDSWSDWMLLGDAQMEQGKLEDAGASYQRAMDQRPGLPLYDRAAWLRWLTGDVDGAVALQERAVAAGSSADPEPYAWVLTRLGWLHALRGEPAPEIDYALELLPDYPPARFARGRIRLPRRRPDGRGHARARRDRSERIDRCGRRAGSTRLRDLARGSRSEACARAPRRRAEESTGCGDAHGPRLRGVSGRRRRIGGGACVARDGLSRATRAAPRRARAR